VWKGKKDLGTGFCGVSVGKQTGKNPAWENPSVGGASKVGRDRGEVFGSNRWVGRAEGRGDPRGFNDFTRLSYLNSAIAKNGKGQNKNGTHREPGDSWDGSTCCQKRGKSKTKKKPAQRVSSLGGVHPKPLTANLAAAQVGGDLVVSGVGDKLLGTLLSGPHHHNHHQSGIMGYAPPRLRPHPTALGGGNA